jgi:hypothetical protein
MTDAARAVIRGAGPWMVVATLVAAWMAAVPLEGIPHVTDEVSYTLQARLFAAGARTGPALPYPSMLSFPYWNGAGASFSPFPPGWPALLAAGEGLGLGWLVNPVLVGLLPLMAWLLGREWAGPRVADLAAVAAAVSPAVLVVAASHMSHTSVLVALAGLLVVVVRGRDGAAWWWIAGGAAAYGVLARPYDAALVGGPLLLLGLLRAPSMAARIPLLLLPGLATALLLADNLALTGSLLRFPMDAYFDQVVGDARAGCNRLGFGADVGCVATQGSFGHTPAKAAVNLWQSVRALDRMTLGMPLGGVAALAGLAMLKRRLPWLILVAVAGGYAMYWSPGQAYGARFWQPMLAVLPVGVAVVAARVGRLAVPLIAAVGLAGTAWLLPDLGDRYWCTDGALRDALAARDIREGVVFVEATGVRAAGWPRLGPARFGCNGVLESGDHMLLVDPTRATGGLQLRHALAQPDHMAPYLAEVHAGAAAWLATHDIAADRWTLRPVAPAAPPATP